MFVAYLIPSRDTSLLDEGVGTLVIGTTREEALAKLRAQFESDDEWETARDYHWCFVQEDGGVAERA